MRPYHKIQTIFKRDLSKPCKPIIEGQWSIPEFEYLANNQWIYTEKVDGANTRVILQDGTLSYKGKNDTDDSNLPPGFNEVLDDMFLPRLNQLRKMFGKGVCLYGEGYGAGIHKGGKYRKDQGLVLLDVTIDGWILERKNVEDIATKLGIEITPIIGMGTLHEAIYKARYGMVNGIGTIIGKLYGRQ